MIGLIPISLKKKKRRSGKAPNHLFMNFSDNHNDKVEVKYQSQSEILIKKIKHILLSVLRPFLIIATIIFLLYGLFYIALFLIVIFSVFYLYKKLKYLLG